MPLATTLTHDFGHSHFHDHLTMSLTYGIIHALRLGWERVSPSICQRARVGVSRVGEADRISSRSFEPKFWSARNAAYGGRFQRVGETEPSFVTKDADMQVSEQAPEAREEEWYRVSQALVSVMRWEPFYLSPSW